MAVSLPLKPQVHLRPVLPPVQLCPVPMQLCLGAHAYSCTGDDGHAPYVHVLKRVNLSFLGGKRQLGHLRSVGAWDSIPGHGGRAGVEGHVGVLRCALKPIYGMIQRIVDVQSS